MRWFHWAIFVAGTLVLVIGPVRFETTKMRAVPGLSGDKPAIEGTGKFVPLGVYPSTSPNDLPPGLQTRGSWLGSDSFKGSYLTDWFQARPVMTLMVAGYPTQRPNRLEVEVMKKDGTSSILIFNGINPAESWQPWTVRLPTDAVSMRIRAVDGSSELGGWLGFSQPFSPVVWSMACLWPFVQIAAAAALALTLLYGPGLIWFSRGKRSAADLGLAALIGPLLLASTGILSWALGGWIRPAITAKILVGLILAFLAFASRRNRSKSSRLPREAGTVIGLGVLLVGFGVAKANLSYAVPGELFHGTVSRTLEVGANSDSRIPYHVVQMVANHLAPYGPESRDYYGTWSFASRGPLAGFLAAPVVLAAGAEVPVSLPNQAWNPFDRQGFAVYRITLIVLASLAGWALFAAAAAVMDSSWALLAASIAFLAPFFVHEMYFTWPKLMAAGCVLTSFVQIRKLRPFSAGAILGIGYLFHPSAILAAPFLGLWIIAGDSALSRKTRFGAAMRFGIGASIFVMAWLAVGALRPGKDGGQDVFLKYFFLAENTPATWQSWRYTRWETFANTFIPFRLLSIPDNYSINSIYGPSDNWVHFGYLYWNTLPFAIGWPALVALAAPLVAACRRTPGLAFIAVLGPALLFVIYWGWETTGVMRDCGHWLLFSTILLGVWTLREPGPSWRLWAITALTSPMLLILRGLDIGWMAFGTALRDHLPALYAPFGANDWISLVLAAAFLAGVVIWLARLLPALRRQLLGRESLPARSRN